MYLSAQLPLVFLRNLCGLSHWLTEEKARSSQRRLGLLRYSLGLILLLHFLFPFLHSGLTQLLTSSVGEVLSSVFWHVCSFF